MKPIDDITISQARTPCGRSATPEEMETAERALSSLLYSYANYELKAQLRAMLRSEAETHPEDNFITDYQLMKPAELYKLIDAAQTLGSYLHHRTMSRLEEKAAAGNQEAAEDLKAIMGTGEKS